MRWCPLALALAACQDDRRSEPRASSVAAPDATRVASIREIDAAPPPAPDAAPPPPEAKVLKRVEPPDQPLDDPCGDRSDPDVGTGTRGGRGGGGKGGCGTSKGEWKSTGTPGGTPRKTSTTVHETKVAFESADATSTSSLTSNELDLVVKSAKGRILACYQRELKAGKDLGGKVSVTFTIDDAGKVTAASIVDTASTLDDDNVERCVVRQIRMLRFPAGVAGDVVYPFLFTPG